MRFWPGLLPKNTSGWVCGPAAAWVYINVYGQSYLQRPSGCLWAGMPPETVWLSEGHVARWGYSDLSGPCAT